MINPGDVDLSELLGALPVAVVQADAQAALASMEYIRRVGFEGPQANADGTSDPANFGPFRMVSFNYMKQQTNGDVQTFGRALPLFSLVTIPLVRIRETTFTFDLNIGQVTPGARTAETAHPAIRAAPAQIRGGIAASRKVGASDARPSIRVSMTVVPSDIPAGIQNMLHVASASGAVIAPLDASGPEKPQTAK